MNRKWVTGVALLLPWGGWAAGHNRTPAIRAQEVPDRAKRAEQIDRRKSEMKQVLEKISSTDQAISAQSQQIEQIQTQLNGQRLLMEDIDRQYAQLQQEGNDRETEDDLRFQQIQIEQGLRISRLKDQIAQQKEHVADLSSQVKRQDASGLTNDDYNKDRNELKNQQQRLLDLQYQEQVQKVQSDSERQKQQAAKLSKELSLKSEQRNLEDQRRAVLAASDRLQSRLDSLQEQRQKSQAELEALTVQRQKLVGELGE